MEKITREAAVAKILTLLGELNGLVADLRVNKYDYTKQTTFSFSITEPTNDTIYSRGERSAE